MKRIAALATVLALLTPTPASAQGYRGQVIRGAKASPARTVSSTAYCLTGRMASGKRVYRGAVAMNNVPLGSRWKILTGPLKGQTLTVEDRIGHSSQFDVAMPGDCRAARRYGRQRIRIQRVR